MWCPCVMYMLPPVSHTIRYPKLMLWLWFSNEKLFNVLVFLFSFGLKKNSEAYYVGYKVPIHIDNEPDNMLEF